MPTWPAKKRVNTLCEEKPSSSPISAIGASVDDQRVERLLHQQRVEIEVRASRRSGRGTACRNAAATAPPRARRRRVRSPRRAASDSSLIDLRTRKSRDAAPQRRPPARALQPAFLVTGGDQLPQFAVEPGQRGRAADHAPPPAATCRAIAGVRAMRLRPNDNPAAGCGANQSALT